MQRASNSYVAVIGSFAIFLSACGGGGGGTATAPPPAATFNLQQGYVNLVNAGLTANVNLSGTAVLNGTSTPFSGTGTLTLTPAVSATFNNSPALSQTETISGTVTVAGQSAPYGASVTDYYAAGSGAVLGESAAHEYDVVQSPFTYPTSVVGGSSGILGTVSRYTDSSLGVPLGTAQISYAVTAPVDPSSPVSVQFTTKTYDVQNTLTLTEVTTFSLTSASVLSFVSDGAQSTSGTLTVTAQ
ncbi:MAG TPA: hypothetical protein VGN30_20180 [Steroidobacteraceae bacterium]